MVNIAANNSSNGWDLETLSKDIFELIKSSFNGIIDFAGDAIENAAEFTKWLFEEVGKEILLKFIKDAAMAVIDFARHPSGGVSLLQQHLNNFISSTIQQLTQAFSSPDGASSLFAVLLGILWMAGNAICVYFTGSGLPFDAPSTWV